jgi:acyl carrier protein
VDAGGVDSYVEEIGRYLVTILGSGNGGIGPDEALLGDFLDSIALLTLATHLEETYGITVGAHDVEAENFGTLRALAGFVARKAARP